MADKKIIGYRIELDDKRSVFLGRLDGDSDYYVQFENHANDKSPLQFRLSVEALDALKDLACGNASEGNPHVIPIAEPELEWESTERHHDV